MDRVTPLAPFSLLGVCPYLESTVCASQTTRCASDRIALVPNRCEDFSSVLSESLLRESVALPGAFLPDRGASLASQVLVGRFQRIEQSELVEDREPTFNDVPPTHPIRLFTQTEFGNQNWKSHKNAEK